MAAYLRLFASHFYAIAALVVAAALWLALLPVTVPAVRAGTIIAVTTTIDEVNSDGDCSLQEAVQAANEDRSVDACPAGDGADTIDVPAGIYRFDRQAGGLFITSEVSLLGAGNQDTILDGDHYLSVIVITGTAAVTIERLQIRNGDMSSVSGGEGGGLEINGGAEVTLRHVVVRDNVAASGGGIYNAGTLRIEASIIAGNVANSGGGILSSGNGTLRITDSTIRNNSPGVSGSSGGGLYIAHGSAWIIRSRIMENGANAYGGGLYILGAEVVIRASTISGNTSNLGGGVYARGSSNPGLVVLLNTTISGNEARGWGGGISSVSIPLRIQNSTITANSVTGTGTLGEGGGMYVGDALVHLRNSIVAGNTAANGASPDCSGTVTSQGYNLIGDTDGCTLDGVSKGNRLNVAPKLGPLSDNGGPTLTHAPLPGSPAIDRGRLSTPGSGGWSCLPYDQRGRVRPQDGDGNGTARCDIGAFELRLTES